MGELGYSSGLFYEREFTGKNKVVMTRKKSGPQWFIVGHDSVVLGKSLNPDSLL